MYWIDSISFNTYKFRFKPLQIQIKFERKKWHLTKCNHHLNARFEGRFGSMISFKRNQILCIGFKKKNSRRMTNWETTIWNSYICCGFKCIFTVKYDILTNFFFRYLVMQFKFIEVMILWKCFLFHHQLQFFFIMMNKTICGKCSESNINKEETWKNIPWKNGQDCPLPLHTIYIRYRSIAKQKSH